MHASTPHETKGCKCGSGNQTQSNTAAGKALLMACCVFSLSILVTVVGLLMYQNDSARRIVPKSICIEEAQARDLAIQLSEITHPDGLIEVSNESLLADRTGYFVFVEQHDLKNRFLRTSVTAVATGDGRMRVVHGLLPGDKVVTKGAERLRWEPEALGKTRETKCNL